MQRGTATLLATVVVLCACAGGCNPERTKPGAAPKVTSFTLESKLMGRPMFEALATPAGGGKGRTLLVFLHGYGAAPRETLSPAFLAALRRLGDRAPVVFLPEGDTGWWHDNREGPWGSYVLREAIPAALARSGPNPHRVAIGRGTTCSGSRAAARPTTHPSGSTSAPRTSFALPPQPSRVS